MNIFYLLSSNDSTGFYRGYQPGLALRELGHQVDFNIDWFDKDPYSEINIDPATLQRKIKAAEEADVVIFQRPGNVRQLQELFRLKQLGKPIVVEHDDLLTDIPEKSPFSAYELDRESLGLCIEGADLVTCTTNYLRKELAQLNPNVEVVPNGIDFSEYTPNPQPHEGFRIGLIGSVAYADNTQRVDLKQIAALPGVTLVVMGLPPRFEYETVIKPNLQAQAKFNIIKLYNLQYKAYEGITNIEFHPFVTIDKYPKYVADLNLDVAIIPRDDSAFNKAKSNIKFLECAALKIPTICQHFPDDNSPYDIDYEQAGSEIMLRCGYGEPGMIEQIEVLINDKERANAITDNAFKYIQRFDIRRTAKVWEEVLSACRLQQSQVRAEETPLEVA